MESKRGVRGGWRRIVAAAACVRMVVMIARRGCEEREERERENVSTSADDG
tara:strand:+ start:383 stop:535 length:153 start_codon:yes stop_codon:yes gene_type:complete